MNDVLLSPAEIERLVHLLADELERRGVHGDLFVVGGAAMALAYSRRRATRDLDAVFEPKQLVYEAARRIADAEGLPQDWLNDAVKGFLPGPDEHATVLFDEPGLTVRVASPRYLFAMKAAAARVDRDADDLRLLYRLCGYRNLEEALADLVALYPPKVLPPKTRFLLEELLGDAPDEASHPCR